MADYKVLKDVAGSSLLVGNTVFFVESGELVPYIYVQNGNNNNMLFIRKYAPDDKVAFFSEAAASSTTEEDRIYEGKTLDRFLSNSFFNRFTDEWQKIFVDNAITVTRIKEGSGVGYTINRKIFAPSASELAVSEQTNGTIPNESPFGAYSYFRTNAQEKRKCRVGGEDGNYVEYWTRSKNNHVGVTFNYYAISIDKNGGYDTGTWQKNDFYVRPVISINKNVTVVKEVSGWRVIPNLPPEMPPSSFNQFSIANGEEFLIEWGVSQDNDGPGTVKYRLQQKVDSGNWNDVVETTDTQYSKVLSYKEALHKVSYRVQAVDDYNNASDWRDVATVTVLNNLPPSAPAYISVTGKYKGEQIVVTWGESVDEDDNLAGYQLLRSVNGSSYAPISEVGFSRTFRDTAGDWDTVKYKVVAVDETGAVSEGKEYSVSLTSRITMSVEITERSDIWNEREFVYGSDVSETSFDVWFLIEDTVDDEHYVVAVTLDDKVVLHKESGVVKGELFVTIDKETWARIPNGEHELRIDVHNSQNYCTSESVRFTKDVSGAFLTFKNPVVVDADDTVSKFLVNVVGSFPEGSTLEVKVTNNANDDSPAWQTVSANEMNTNEFIVFNNKTAQNGSAFNITVEANRGTATEPCFISSVNGMFGRNLFEYIFERLDSLEAGAINE